MPADSETGPEEPAPGPRRGLARHLARLADVEDAELPALGWACAANFCLLGAWYAIRPLRETFGVEAGDDLPLLFSGTLVASLLFIPIYWRLVARLGRRRLAPVFYHGSALCLLAFYVLFLTIGRPAEDGGGAAAQIVGGVFFVWASAYVLFANALLWSLLVDLHGSIPAKRLFGLIFAGGTAGGLLSSAFVALSVRGIGTEHVFLVPIALLELTVVCIARLDRAAGRAASGPVAADAEPLGGRLLEGLRLIARSPYMLGICGYMFFATFFGTVLYSEQQGIVDASVAGRDAQTQLFSWMNFFVQLLTVVGQALITARFLRRLGITAALVLLPLFLASSLVTLGLATVLSVLVVVQVLQRSVGFAIAKPSKEILYTVVSREAKYKSKGFIDTIVYRGGDAVSSWAFSGLQALGLGLSGTAFAAAPLCLAWIALCVRLGRRQAQLERAGAGAAPEALGTAR